MSLHKDYGQVRVIHTREILSSVDMFQEAMTAYIYSVQRRVLIGQFNWNRRVVNATHQLNQAQSCRREGREPCRTGTWPSRPTAILETSEQSGAGNQRDNTIAENHTRVGTYAPGMFADQIPTVASPSVPTAAPDLKRPSRALPTFRLRVSASPHVCHT